MEYYQHSDWVGSSRLASTPSRGIAYDTAYAAFGEPYAISGTNSAMSEMRFAGHNSDMLNQGSEPIYDAWYREYSFVQRRWLQPDPSGLAAVNPANPQSWNRYGYVGNNPLMEVDPSGLFWDKWGCWEDSREEKVFCPSDPVIFQGSNYPPYYGPEPFGGGGTEHKKIQKCNSQRAKFIKNNLKAAINLSQLWNTSAYNILGLASFESGDGTDTQARIYNNFYGEEVGSNCGINNLFGCGYFSSTAIGTFSIGNYNYESYTSFYYSTLALLMSPYGTRIANTQSPSDFANLIEGNPFAYNSTNPDYINSLINRIKDIRNLIILCF